MPDLTYFMVAPQEPEAGSIDNFPQSYLTMLATGDDDADYEAMEEQAREVGMKDALVIGKWRSSSSGEKQHEDGKDKFRAHELRHMRLVPGLPEAAQSAGWP